MRTRTSLAVGAIGLALTFGLSSCANPAEQLADSLIEQLVESQTGGEVQVDRDGDGGYSIKTQDGSVSIGSSAELPDDFPDEHPLPNGTLTSAWETEGNWQLVFQSTARSEYERLIDHYSSQGYQEVLRTEPSNINDHQMALYENDRWGVVITWEDVEDGTLTYTLSTR